MNIKLVILTYLIFKFSQLLLAIGIEETTIKIIACAVGFGIPVILALLAFKNITFFKWLLALTIIVGGASTLYTGIFTLENDQMLLRILAFLLGGYLSIGSYFIVIKTKNKEKWA